MKSRKIVSTLLSTIAAVSAIVATASGAQASKLVSGVAIPGGSVKGSSVFLSSDPAYGNTFNYSTYLINTLKTGKVGCGVNLPALNEGVLNNLGKFQEFLLYYDVPNNGPSADPGVNVVIQTSDGFSRIANAVSGLWDSGNGYNVYQIDLLPGDFSPAFSPNQTVLQTASVRYNGRIGPIYVFYPAVIGKQKTLEGPEWNYKVVPDPQFVGNQ